MLGSGPRTGFDRARCRAAAWIVFLLLTPVASLFADDAQVFQARKLVAHAERYGFLGGYAVSIDGDRAAVASPATAGVITSLGEGYQNVFIFQRHRYRTNEWGFVTEVRTNLFASVPALFGTSVSLSGDQLAIGAPGDVTPGVPGQVYICDRNAGGTDHWGIAQFLTAPGGGSNRDGFGTAVWLDKTNLVVGLVERSDPIVPALGLASSALMYQRTGGTWSFVKTLTGTPRGFDDRLGSSVSLSGDVAVVGAPFDSNTLGRVGAAYVFERNQGGTGQWGQVAKLQPGDLALSDEFGHAVGVSGSNLVVGAHRQNQPGTPWDRDGAAYVFKRSAGPAWTQTKKLTSPDPAFLGGFGSAVFMDGDRVAIGEPSTLVPGMDPPGYDLAGRVFLYDRTLGGADQWGLVREIQPPNDGAANLFGASVALDGNDLLVGDPGDGKSGAGVYAGDALVFGKDQDGTNAWGLVTRLVPTEYDPATYFGSAAAVDGNTMAVGMPFKKVFGIGTNNGVAYIFERDWGGDEEWGLVVSLYAPGSISLPGQQFGAALALDGDGLAVGAPGYPGTNGTMAGAGAVGVYGPDPSGSNKYGQVKWLTPNTLGTNNHYGAAVALRGDVLVAGAPGKDTGGIDAGSIYVHYRHHLVSNSWSQLGELQAVPPVPFAQFGSALALDNGTNLIVGAPFDNTDAALAGAAYILPLTGGQIRLPAVALPATSFFGQSVDLDGEWAVVGAYGDPDNGNLAGAAYLFRENQGGVGHWGQFKKIKPSDGTTNQLFGWSVALDGDLLVVSARGDSRATNSAGALYTFGRNAGGSNNWGQLQKIFATRPETNAQLGYAVALSGHTVVAGAAPENLDGSQAGGAAYVFDDLLAYIRSYGIATGGMHRLDLTVTPHLPYQVQRSAGALTVWTNHAGPFMPSHRYPTQLVPAPTGAASVLRIQYAP